MQNSIQIGGYLLKEKILLDVLYTSTANRAQASAELISDALKLDVEKTIPDDELFQASVRTFLEFINKIDDAYSHVMCIGHNPVISYLAEYLCAAEIGDMPTSGLAIIKFNVNSWKELTQGVGELQKFVTPDSLSG
jgi:phosphohistidine phosphatase